MKCGRTIGCQEVLGSYTQSLRFQLKDSGVEVIEWMPPAIRTDITTELAEGGISMITADRLVKLTFAALKAGTLAIRPGHAQIVRERTQPFIGARCTPNRMRPALPRKMVLPALHRRRPSELTREYHRSLAFKEIATGFRLALFDVCLACRHCRPALFWRFAIQI